MVTLEAVLGGEFTAVEFTLGAADQLALAVPHFEAVELARLMPLSTVSRRASPASDSSPIGDV